MSDVSAFFETKSAKIPASALPRTAADQATWLQLARSRRVGPATFIRLIREHGSAAAALQALPKVAADAGARGYAPCNQRDVDAELEAAHKVGAQMLCLGTHQYPPLLALIPDPPPLVWAIGDPELATQPAVGLVGARNSSSLGQRMAAKLASELGEAGYVIASGMARGVDTAAHNASLKTGTIAVLAGGVETVYPRENQALWEQLSQQGLILSEAPIGTAPQARHFPKRNRIISGLSAGIVVIEGAAKSGSLITARNALDQGREVMAVPGSPLDPRATGCNMLLRDGAALIRSAADIIECLAGSNQPQFTLTTAPVPHRPTKPPATPKARPPENHIKSLLSIVPTPEDSIIRESALPAPDVLEIICDMELAGTIQRHPGGMISLTA